MQAVEHCLPVAGVGWVQSWVEVLGVHVHPTEIKLLDFRKRVNGNLKRGLGELISLEAMASFAKPDL